MRYLGDGSPLSPTQAGDYIARAIEHESKHGFSRLAVDLIETGELIGMCGIARLEGYNDLGYRFAKRHWGRGYATESARAVVKHGFDTLDLPRIDAVVLLENRASRAVIEKLGFEHVGDASAHGRRAARYRQINPETADKSGDGG